jgi:hypothetical protein
MSHALLHPPAGATPVQVSTRFGLKGAHAPSWLTARGIPVPDSPNRIARWSGGRCLRQGHGEFLVEVDDAGSRDPLSGESAAGEQQVWMLLRSDHCLLLEGGHWPDILSQACSFDLDRLRADPGLIVMTLLAGISVTLAAEPRPDESSPFALRLWCDASYALYLDHCLQQLAAPSLPENKR